MALPSITSNPPIGR